MNELRSNRPVALTRQSAEPAALPRFHFTHTRPDERGYFLAPPRGTREAPVDFSRNFFRSLGVTFGETPGLHGCAHERRGQQRVDQQADHLAMMNVRDGDIGRLGFLFEQHHLSLFNFFLRLTGNRNVSEDLVQDSFFRMLKYRHTYRDASRFTTWMYQIARNAHVDHYKKRRGEVALGEEAEQRVSPHPAPGAAIEREQEMTLLRDALAMLPADKRELLVLSRFQQLKYEEIGTILNCDAGTIKVRVHRALKELRENYEKLSGKKE